jgi:hypothetical protein
MESAGVVCHRGTFKLKVRAFWVPTETHTVHRLNSVIVPLSKDSYMIYIAHFPFSLMERSAGRILV